MRGRVLIIAGSDSGGGAGIQTDIKTVTMLDGFAATAITALTAQNTLGVFGVLPIAPGFIRQQIEPAAIDALKTLLIPRAAILTPNLPEAEILAGRRIDSLAAMHSAAEVLLRLGCRAVLLKGGHLAGDTVHDVLATAAGQR